MTVIDKIYGYPLWLIPFIMLVGIICLVLFSRKHSPQILQRINIALLILGLLGIARFTLLGRTPTDTHIFILRPFESFAKAKIEPEYYRSMLMNIFLYYPMGLALPYILSKRFKYCHLWTILIALALTTCIEYSQYCFGTGYGEVDDILCNTLGALIGSLAYLITKIGSTHKNATD